MKKFCVLCSSLQTSVPDDLKDQLRTLPGVQLNRVVSGTVSVYFDGTEADLLTLLAETGWSAFHVRVSQSRTYRLL